MAKQPFVTYGAGLPKSPSGQTIAHWIMDTIEATLVTATVGPVQAQSTQSVSTSVALFGGVSIKIIRAADLDSVSVFANHYLKKQCEREGKFTGAVLGSNWL